MLGVRDRKFIPSLLLVLGNNGAAGVKDSGGFRGGAAGWMVGSWVCVLFAGTEKLGEYIGGHPPSFFLWYWGETGTDGVIC